jgi:hypothetical protein
MNARRARASRALLCRFAVADRLVAVARSAPGRIELAVHTRQHLRADERRVALGFTAQLDANAAAVRATATRAAIVARIVDAIETRGAR